jgi:hypothetical protein
MNWDKYETFEKYLESATNTEEKLERLFSVVVFYLKDMHKLILKPNKVKSDLVTLHAIQRAVVALGGIIPTNVDSINKLVEAISLVENPDYVPLLLELEMLIKEPSNFDYINRFIEEKCVRGSVHRVRFNAFYPKLVIWCNEHDKLVPSKKSVGCWLTDAGFKTKSSDGRWYLGIKLKETNTGDNL